MAEVPKNCKGISAFPRERVRRHPGDKIKEKLAYTVQLSSFLMIEQQFRSTNLRLRPYVAPDEGPLAETLLS